MMSKLGQRLPGSFGPRTPIFQNKILDARTCTLTDVKMQAAIHVKVKLSLDDLANNVRQTIACSLSHQ